ncbi:Uncharacterised protein [Kluyvera cryocrescens]|uniref:Glycine-rich domain-containing protein n=1 Tax=Kluyvera cryocrescens TaxID=580 RepID=A0A485BNP7_KLUCR|nr:Uncharacterised protein [Kluyvera cryocrescens]
MHFLKGWFGRCELRAFAERAGFYIFSALHSRRLGQKKPSLRFRVPVAPVRVQTLQQTMCAASGSGTSGAYAKAIIDNPTPQQITVGSGGKGGVNNPAGNGNAGGQSSFGSLVTAIGGLGGEAMTAGTGVWSAFFSGTMPAIQFTGASISRTWLRGCLRFHCVLVGFSLIQVMAEIQFSVPVVSVAAASLAAVMAWVTELAVLAQT